jgi:hypothetical protein
MTTPPPQPATPADVLRWAADRAEAHGAPYASLTDLRRWADELDTPPAACTCPTIGAGHSPDCPTHGTGTTGMASGDGVAGNVHEPFTDDGVTYCGWSTGSRVVDGCGEVWPCTTVRTRTAAAGAEAEHG